MSNDIERNCDIKMLVLKRWDLDQTNKLFDPEIQRGDYISFQSYHFVDIITPPIPQNLRDIYGSLRQKSEIDIRNSFAETKWCENDNAANKQVLDIHTVQSVAILSNSRNEAFWDAESPLLGITFLQLTDSTQWHFEKIQKELESIIGSQMQWALYYSLDFSDLVLFTKNFEIENLHDILWRVALVRKGKCKVVCDTFTVLCFSATFLQKNFEHFDNANSEETTSKELLHSQVWQDKLSLSINLSLKNTTALSQLIKNITAEGVEFVQYRSPGRYDVNIQIPNISGNQAVKILYLVDQQACLKKRRDKNRPTLSDQDEECVIQPIGNYEVIFMSGAWSGRCREESFPESKQEFEVKVLTGLDSILQRFENLRGEHSEHIYETIRALRELSNNGFSEEFVLSVYPSFVTYIELLKEAEEFLQVGEISSALKQSCKNITKNYFTALNTLTLCTMHSERQFIHAPAFNATYFEIPPKLLAFYNAIVERIASCLSGDGPQLYRYMITPDYRSDIYVQPLNVEYKQDTSVHLAIIHLPEKYFYDPESAMMLLSHEVGHYEGERNRELRAKLIFTMVGVTLLMETSYFPRYDESSDPLPKDSLVIALAEEFGEFLYEVFFEEMYEPNRGISGHLCDVSYFLERNSYGLKFFEAEESRQIIVHRWQQCLNKKNVEHAFPTEEAMYILSKYDTKIKTDYYGRLLKTNDAKSAVEPICRILADRCALIIENSVLKDTYSTIVELGQTIIQAFSEAFSDMHMVRMCGRHFSLKKFVELLLQNNSNVSEADIAGQITLEHVIRYNTICEVFGLTIDDYNLELTGAAIISTIVEYVASYIRNRMLAASPVVEMAEFINDFLSRDSFEQCKSMSSVLSEYKAKIIEELGNIRGAIQ